MTILRTDREESVEIKSFCGGDDLGIFTDLAANLDEIKRVVEGAAELSFYTVGENEDGTATETLSYKEYGAFELKKILGRENHVKLIFAKSSDEIKLLKAQNKALSEEVTALQLALVELYENGGIAQ